jgi:hypothetical protein
MNLVILALASLGTGGANFLGDASILRMARRLGFERARVSVVAGGPTLVERDYTRTTSADM